MIKRLFTSSTNSLSSAALIVASFSILSRVVGFIRDRILAGEFGASDTLDVYFVAFRIPDLFYSLIIVGALSASFIPLFTRYYSKKKLDKAWYLTNNILTILTLAFGVLIAIAALFAPQLAAIIGQGFDAEKQAAVATMMRIMFLAQFLLAISMVFGSVLQGAKYFFVYSLAPIFYNVGIIFGVVMLVPVIGEIGLAWGVVLGAALHFILQSAAVYAMGYRYKLVFDLKHKDIIYTLKHMLPRVMGLAVSQLNFIVMTIIASSLAIGSVTMLQFAYNLNFFPVGVIAVSYAIAAFPTLCEQSGKKHEAAFRDTLSSTLRQMFLFIIPATILFIMLRAQIVRVVLGAGEFGWKETILTANTMAFFIGSLFAQSVVFILVRAYFAKDDTKTPFIMGSISAGVNIIAALLLVPLYGVIGLGIAYSIAAFCQMVLLILPLRSRIGSMNEGRIARSLTKLVFAGVVCGISVQFMKNIVVEFITLDTFLGVLAQGLIAGTVGFIIYLGTAYLFKSEELLEFLAGLKKKLFERSQAEETIVTQLSQ
jgi:putative peptidoglycan lipid II flippase